MASSIMSVLSPRARSVLATSGGGGGGSKKDVAPVHPMVKMISGMAAGTVEACSLQPLDVAKTRLQLDHAGKYRGLVHTVRTVASEEGPRALYKGLTPFVTHLTIKYALRFGAFGYFKTLLPESKGQGNEFAKNFVAGLGSGVTEAVIVVTPFEVVKIRMQKQHGLDKALLKYKNPVHCATTMIREEGAASLWKGVVPTMIRQGSNQAFNFSTFYFLNNKLFAKRDGDAAKQPMWQTVGIGLFAAAVGPCCNCPMDVVKTRLMAQVSVPGEAPKYSGFWQATKLIAKEEGVRALWKGLIPRLARLAPGQAITWTVVSRVQYFFEKRAQEEQEQAF